METTANGTSPFQCGFGSTAPAGRDGTALGLPSRGTTALALIAGLMERGRRMVPDARRCSAACEGECGREILGELGGKLDLLLRQRVGECQAASMKELAFEPEVMLDAVDGIAAHR
jgi:hypothetical protein